MNKSELLARIDASNKLTEEVRQTAARSEQTMQDIALTVKHSRWLVAESGRIRQVHKYSIFLPHKTRKELA